MKPRYDQLFVLDILNPKKSFNVRQSSTIGSCLSGHDLTDYCLVARNSKTKATTIIDIQKYKGDVAKIQEGINKVMNE